MNTQLNFFRSVSETIDNIGKLDTDCILVVIDVNLLLLYKEEFKVLSQIKNKKILIYKASSGEGLKEIREFEKCVNFFLEGGVHRNSHLVAIGGGVTSDFAGFVASSLLRGITWSVIPTTLLSMVDASIGGKVGLNVDCGKNLIGAFHRPEHIWVCNKFLGTLPDAELQSGKGEILKYAFLDPSIGEFLLERNLDFSELIKKCSEYKLNLTAEDFREKGNRKILNLGHTFGHAIEKNYLLSHGLSVFLGLIVIFVIRDDQGSLEKLKAYVEAIGLGEFDIPWHNRNFPGEDIFLYMQKDKKVHRNNYLELIIIEENKPKIHEISFEDLKSLIEGKDEQLKKIVI